jgi:hypothetical protein
VEPNHTIYKANLFQKQTGLAPPFPKVDLPFTKPYHLQSHTIYKAIPFTKPYHLQTNLFQKQTGLAPPFPKVDKGG